MPDGFDVERFIAAVHAAPPEILAQHLDEMLADPERNLEKLKVFVPEVSSMVCNRIVSREYGALDRMARSLGGVLDAHREHLGARNLPSRTRSRDVPAVVAYYLGRLQSVVVMAAQVPAIDVSPMVRAEALDGSDNQAILFLLAQRGPMSIRTLRLALNGVAVGPVRSMEHVRKCLARLIHVGAVETEHRSSRVIYYRLSELGERLLEVQPEWMHVVLETYRTHRDGKPPPLLPYAERLAEKFAEIDAESRR